MTIKRNKLYNELTSFKVAKSDPYAILERELGPAIKAYRRKWELSSKRKKIFRYPLHLNVELSHGCNMRCSFCVLGLSKGELYYKAGSRNKISFCKYCKIIDEGAEKGLCSVALNGYNEPLIKKDIVKYVKYAKKRGILDISLHTNGLLLTSELSGKLITSGLTSIMFSVDAATKKTYKKIRGSDFFARAVSNIVDFIKIRKKLKCVLPLVRLSFVETKANIKELDAFITFWKEKADYFALQSFSNPFVGLSAYKKAEEDYRVKNTPFSACAGPYQRLTITCDGNVYPCCSYYGLYLPVGNIYSSAIGDIWKCKLLRDLRRNVNLTDKQPQACKKCRASFMSTQ